MEDLLKIASHCLFDGWIIKGKGKYRLGYSNKNIVLANEFSKDVEKMIGFKPYQRTRPNAIEIEFSNKKLFCKVIKLITLKKYFLKDFYSKLIRNKNLIKIVLKTFWDDEGMVGFYKGKNKIIRKLRARCCNKKLRKQLLKLHQILGICAHEEYDKKGIIITDRKSIINFSLKINFTKGVKVVKSNILRPTWKNREKTEILALLLESYKKYCG